MSSQKETRERLIQAWAKRLADGVVSSFPKSAALEHSEAIRFLQSELTLLLAEAGCDSAKESAEPEEWISVDERLPEMDGITYLVYRIEHKSGVRFIDTFTAQGQAAWHNRRRNLASGITHWRPLPKPSEHAQKGK